MKTQLRLNSVIPFGVGSSPENNALDLIYSILLNKYSQNQYSHININQIGADLEEFISKNGKKIHININCFTPEDFDIESSNEKNRIRLNVIHEALIQIAKKDKKIDIQVLEKIKNEILKNNFSFDFIYKTFKHNKKELSAEIIVHPEIDEYKFYAFIREKNVVKCNLLIYQSQTGILFDYFFSNGNWIDENHLIINGKEKQVEIRIDVSNCEVEYKNLTNYSKAPLFELMRAGITKEEKEIAHKNWLHSLPPAIASVIREDKNN